MKKILATLVLSLAAMSSFAEATFDQIEGLIQQKNYAAAASGLEVIIQNHPKSSKAFYAMAQAQAGLGNLEKANKALNIATGLNPTLDFAPSSSVASLKQAITPQVSKIEAVEETHTVRNTVLIIFVLALGFVVYTVYRRNKEADEAYEATLKAEREAEYARTEAKVKRMQAERERQEAEAKLAAETAEVALKAHKNYNHERFDPANPDKLKTVKRMKEEAAEKQRLFLEAEARRERQQELSARLSASNAASGPAYAQPMYTPQPTHTTVVNNSGSDLVTGMMLGSMMNNHNHDTYHDTTVIRETVREVPAAPSRSSSWDDTPSPSSSSSRSSSWDDSSPSSSSSSSWGSSSSSDSSSSDSSSSSDW